MRYRSKVVEIEAKQWMGPEGDVSVEDLREWGAQVEPTALWGDNYTLLVWNTEENQFINCPVSHWIIKGLNGEFYPCSPSVFEKKYEAVE